MHRPIGCRGIVAERVLRFDRQQIEAAGRPCMSNFSDFLQRINIVHVCLNAEPREDLRVKSPPNDCSIGFKLLAQLAEMYTLICLSG